MTRPRVLLVADWTVEPETVVTEATRCEGAFGIVVPAWLHGLDWAGDPHASIPCACTQLASIAELAAKAGLDVEFARVGDPDPATAIYDAVHDWPASEVLLFARARRLAFRPLDLQHRAQRLTGLPVRVPATAGAGRRSGHCVPETAAAA
jgi:hypothetical protein